MTLKNIDVIAAATAEFLADDLALHEHVLLVRLTLYQCIRLLQNNPNFDGDKFLRASGLTEEEL